MMTPERQLIASCRFFCVVSAGLLHTGFYGAWRIIRSSPEAIPAPYFAMMLE